MSQTILIDDNKTDIRLYTLNLNIYVGTDIVSKTNVQEAIDLLKVHPSIDLIIAKNKLATGPSAELLQNFLIENERHVPLIFIDLEAGAELKYDLAESLANNDLKTIVRAAAKALGVTAKMMMEKSVPDYYPIPMQMFLSIEEVNCEVFLRLRKNQGTDFQYVKRLHQGDRFNAEDINKYLSFGEKFFYIPAKDRLTFTNFYTTKLTSTLKDTNISTDKRMVANQNAQLFVGDTILNLGITEETVDLSNAAIESMATSVKDNPKLTKMVSALFNNKTGYLYQHSQLLTHFCSYTIDQMDWGIEGQKAKLGFIAFFHDIALGGNEKLARIRNTEELKKARLSSEEESLVNKHALIAGELLTHFPSAPMASDVILRQHHGQISGVGFPQFVSGQISPLTMVFIIAEEATDLIISSMEKTKSFKKEVIVQTLMQKYNTAKWKKIIEGIEQTPL